MGLVVVAGVIFYSWDQKQRQIDELHALNQQMQNQLEERREMIDRLSRSRRLAHLDITKQDTGPDHHINSTTFTFIELGDDGSELARQNFTVPGQTIFIDAWTIKFDPHDVAIGDGLRGHSIVLFRRVYSDLLPPAEGIAIDTPGAVPPGYAAEDIGKYEQRLWASFWELAQNPDEAAKMGVRVAQGEAVYKPVKVGQSYELSVDAVGGMNLTPLAPANQALTSAEH